MKKVFVYNIIIFLCLIFFLELTVRIFSSVNLLGIKSDLIIENSEPFSYKPNAKSIIFGKTVFTDEHGFRVPSSKFKYGGARSVLVLGDSTSYGVGVNEEKTFIGILRKKFPELNIYNTSLAGHNINDHIQIIEKYKLKLNIKKIYFFLNLNDIVYLDTRTRMQNFKNEKNNLSLIDKFKKVNIISQTNFFLRSKSALYVYIKSMVTNPSKTHFQDIYNMYQDEKNLVDYQKKLNKLIQNVGKNIELNVVLLPWEHQLKNQCANKDLLFPQDFITKYFLDKKVVYFNVTNNFCKNKKSEEMYLKFDPAHLSSKGHKYIENIISENNLF